MQLLKTAEKSKNESFSLNLLATHENPASIAHLTATDTLPIQDTNTFTPASGV